MGSYEDVIEEIQEFNEDDRRKVIDNELSLGINENQNN